MPAGLDVRAFCLEVVAATADVAACYKPNIAFFERLGIPGLEALVDVMAAIRERGIPIILDAKRGDVPNTAAAYADAYFGGPFDVDALTVNASVGLDALEPFVVRARERDRGVLVLLRTSNPGAALFQEAAEPILLGALRDEPTLGAVVGATDATTGARLRRALPETFFLVPGFGAQGGADLRAFFTGAGRGAVVNSSRSILEAGYGRTDWKDAVRAAARTAHETIERARRR